MGCTSTEVCLIRDQRAQKTFLRIIKGYPIRVTSHDIHTIGAGGSSIAKVDEGGMLSVGPESAGANPGPACYEPGGEHVTVTAANKIGRAAGRERVCKYVEISVVDVTLKKKIKINKKERLRK